MRSAQDLIEGLSLRPLEGEGGMWAPIFNNGAASAIYFLMQSPDFSAWHRIPEQEMWIHVAGSATALYTFEPGIGVKKSVIDHASSVFHVIVPPGRWMAARADGGWSLVICTLTPAYTSMELATRAEVETWSVDDLLADEVRSLLHD